MMGLYDRSQYFQFIRSELNTGESLTQAVFQLANANGTLKDTFSAVYPAVNNGLDTFSSFRYSTVNDETVRPLVLQAMMVKTVYYVGDPSANPAAAAHLPMTFAGAVNAVNEIEYLCTRQGISYLLNHGVAQTTISADANGTLVFNPASPGGSGAPGVPTTPTPGNAAATNH